MVREKEMERGLERGMEGWGGPLIWKVWCEWRTSGSPRWWILLHMQCGKVIHPSFSFFYLLPAPASPALYLSLPSHHHATTFSPRCLSLTSLPPSCFSDSFCLFLVTVGAAVQTHSQTLSFVAREKIAALSSTLDTHIRTLALDSIMTFHKKWICKERANR